MDAFTAISTFFTATASEDVITNPPVDMEDSGSTTGYCVIA